MVDKRQYAERRSGELLPRHASAYIPPHRIPAQPDARTMENRTVRVAPELDPRQQLTQVSMQRVRAQRRGHWGIVVAAAGGTLLAVVAYAALLGFSGPGASALGAQPVVSESQAVIETQAVIESRGAREAASRNRTTEPAASDSVGGSSALLPVDAARDGVPGLRVAEEGVVAEGVVEEITDETGGVVAAHGKPAARTTRNANSRLRGRQSVRSTKAPKKSSNSEPSAAEHDPDGIKPEGPKVWLE